MRRDPSVSKLPCYTEVLEALPEGLNSGGSAGGFEFNTDEVNNGVMLAL